MRFGEVLHYIGDTCGILTVVFSLALFIYNRWLRGFLAQRSLRRSINVIKNRASIIAIVYRASESSFHASINSVWLTYTFMFGCTLLLLSVVSFCVGAVYEVSAHGAAVGQTAQARGFRLFDFVFIDPLIGSQIWSDCLAVGSMFLIVIGQVVLWRFQERFSACLNPTKYVEVTLDRIDRALRGYPEKASELEALHTKILGMAQTLADRGVVKLDNLLRPKQVAMRSSSSTHSVPAPSADSNALLQKRIEILSPASGETVSFRRIAIGICRPMSSKLQVFVYSGDKKWWPQQRVIADGDVWTAECQFGAEKTGADSQFAIVAIEIDDIATGPVDKLPPGGAVSKEVVVRR